MRKVQIQTPANTGFKPGRFQRARVLHEIFDEQKSVSYEFNTKKFQTIELIHITDLQFGHIAFREDKFAHYRDWILEVPNRFIMLGGDLIDAATPISVGSPYENKFEPSKQCYAIKDLLMPLQGRILGSVGGNHERRTIKTFGDTGKLIASFLDIPYSSGLQYIHVKFGQHNPFKIKLHHGTGAARTPGARLNMIQRLADHADAQLTLVGHLHDAIIHLFWRERSTEAGIHHEKCAVAMSSSFVGYFGTYAEVSGLPCSDTMMVRTILYPDAKWEVTLR
jgi:hypothetical protein